MGALVCGGEKGIDPVFVGFDEILSTTRWHSTLTPNLAIECLLTGMAGRRDRNQRSVSTDRTVLCPRTTAKG